MKNTKLTNLLLIALPALAVALNALPWCVKMQFIGDGETLFTEYFSGFSLLPAGYGVWSHMVAGICGAILLVLGLIHVRTDSVRALKWMMSISIVGVLMSVTPFAFGTATALSTLVALAIGAEAVIVYRLREDQ